MFIQPIKDDTNVIDLQEVDKPLSTDGAQSPDSEDVSNDTSARSSSSVKRLRLRGDWSDTGPGARPERERRQNPQPRPLNQQEETSGKFRRQTRRTQNSLILVVLSLSAFCPLKMCLCEF